ncbi:MAG: hypothetical protein ACFFDN_17615 [Candidatus Hodarchaeota archaeon]
MSDNYYQVEVQEAAISYMIRDEIIKRFEKLEGGFLSDDKQEWFHSPVKEEAEIAKEITGNEIIIGEYEKEADKLINEKSFTWGT